MNVSYVTLTLDEMLSNQEHSDLPSLISEGVLYQHQRYCDPAFNGKVRLLGYEMHKLVSPVAVTFRVEWEEKALDKRQESQ